MNSSDKNSGHANTLGLLELEYEHLSRTIDKFDAQLFQVRSWAIAAVGAVLALGLPTNRIEILLAGVVPVLFFWFLELVLKWTQVQAITKSRNVERLIQALVVNGKDPVASGYRFGIGQALSPQMQVRHLFSMVLERRLINIFYLALMAAMLLAAILVALIK